MSINVQLLSPTPTASQLVATTSGASENTDAQTKVVVLNTGGTDLKYINRTKSYGEINFYGNTTVTTVTAIATPVVVSSILFQLNAFSTGMTLGNNSRLIFSYSGKYLIQISLSCFTGVNNQTIAGLIALNGNVILSTQQTSDVSSARSQNITLSAILNITATNYVELYIQNNTATNSITVSSCNIQAFILQ